MDIHRHVDYVCRAISEGLVAGLSPQRTEILPRTALVWVFSMDEVLQKEVCLRVLWYSPTVSFLLHAQYCYHLPPKDTGLANESGMVKSKANIIPA
jgi:hypothetical protein